METTTELGRFFQIIRCGVYYFCEEPSTVYSHCVYECVYMSVCIWKCYYD
ncbi:hypothetical protein YC2023_083256 [Brassica napus]